MENAVVCTAVQLHTLLSRLNTSQAVNFRDRNFISIFNHAAFFVDEAI